MDREKFYNDDDDLRCPICGAEWGECFDEDYPCEDFDDEEYDPYDYDYWYDEAEED